MRGSGADPETVPRLAPEMDLRRWTRLPCPDRFDIVRPGDAASLSPTTIGLQTADPSARIYPSFNRPNVKLIDTQGGVWNGTLRRTRSFRGASLMRSTASSSHRLSSL